MKEYEHIIIHIYMYKHIYRTARKDSQRPDKQGFNIYIYIYIYTYMYIYYIYIYICIYI
jgi:hypothetical protein